LDIDHDLSVELEAAIFQSGIKPGLRAADVAANLIWKSEIFDLVVVTAVEVLPVASGKRILHL
jgi:hypothetical protein